MCRKAFSPAKGGANPEAMLLASGHLGACPICNLQIYKITSLLVCKLTSQKFIHVHTFTGSKNYKVKM
jgi:hypothetical protein